MHKLAIMMVLFVLCLPPGPILAETAPAAAPQPYRQSLDLAAAIDARASTNGLSTGDGTISAGEQAVADAIWNEINSFDQQVSEFEDASAENRNWVEAVDQRVGEFDQQIAAVQAAPITDPRALAISGAVDLYGQPLPPRPRDPRAEAISGAVELYGQPLPPRPRDPRAEAISGAVDQYGQEASGGSDLSVEDQQNVTRTVREGTHDFIDRSPVRRRNITKRYIDQMIEIAVPGAYLPINGYWRPLPFAMQTSGTCQVMNADSDGPSGDEGEDPGDPLCGYENLGSLPFIFWNGVQPYMSGTASMYGVVPDEWVELVSDQNGATIGSMPVRRTTVYEVVAPDTIVVHIVLEEQGGCSVSGDYILELVTPDESVCTSIDDIRTQEEQVPLDEEEPPLPVDEGPYTVGLPYGYTAPTDCQTVTTPDISEIRLLEQPDTSLMIDYGAGTQVVYFTGGGRYQYGSAFNIDPHYTVSLNRNSDGTGGTISWLVRADAGDTCSTMQDFYIPGSPSDPALAPDDSGSESGESGESGQASDSPTVFPPVPGDYTVTWTGIPGLDCLPDLQEQIPTFTEATVTQVDTGFEVQGGGQSYLLAAMSGQYIYMPMNADGSGAIFNLTGMESDANLYGSYNAFTADGQFCLMSAVFAPK
jgi:hypothetical protein